MNMQKKITIEKPKMRKYNVPLSTEERLEMLRGIRGMWKDRKPDPIEELEQMRKEWDK